MKTKRKQVKKNLHNKKKIFPTKECYVRLTNCINLATERNPPNLKSSHISDELPSNDKTLLIHKNIDEADCESVQITQEEISPQNAFNIMDLEMYDESGMFIPSLSSDGNVNILDGINNSLVNDIYLGDVTIASSDYRFDNTLPETVIIFDSNSEVTEENILNSSFDMSSESMLSATSINNNNIPLINTEDNRLYELSIEKNISKMYIPQKKNFFVERQLERDLTNGHSSEKLHVHFNSHYLPDTINKDKIGDAFQNVKNVIVKTSNEKTYICMYCKREYMGKISEHLLRCHKDEELIKLIESLPPAKKIKGQKLSHSQLLRLKVLNYIKSQGNFISNIAAEKHDYMHLSRNPISDRPLSDYRFCGFCNELLLKSTIKKHLKLCIGTNQIGKVTTFLHEMVKGDIHPRANNYLRIIESRMHRDDVHDIIKKDFLITLYGNDQAFKYRQLPHHGKQIRANLRLLGRLVREAIVENEKQGNPYKITDLQSLLNPDYIIFYFEIVNKLGACKIDGDDENYEKPNVPGHIGRLVVECCQELSLELMSHPQLQKDKEMVDNFLSKHERKFKSYVGKTVSESKTNMELKSGLTQLPEKNDIKKLNDYVTNIRDRSLKKLLDSGFDELSYLNLLKTTLISILVFNRKRPGELARLKIVPYRSTLTKIDENCDPEYFKKLSDIGKELASKYSRCLGRGKKNKKKAPVLFDKSILNCIEIILMFREQAGIHPDNPFIFALPGDKNRVLEACPLMTKYANESGAEKPNLLRAVLLRKQIATEGIHLNLTEGQVENLSTFLGHDKGIHLSHYRQPVAYTDILQVSKYLESAMGDYVETIHGPIKLADNLPDEVDYDEAVASETHCQPELAPSENHQPELSALETSSVELVSLSHPDLLANPCSTPNQTPSGNKAKHRWSQEHSDLIRSEFYSIASAKKSISGNTIREFCKVHKITKNIADVRSHLQYLVSKSQPKKTKTNSPGSRRKRNIVPNFIYRHFQDYICNRKEPTIAECVIAYQNSPEGLVRNYPPSRIQELVRIAIEFDDD